VLAVVQYNQDILFVQFLNHALNALLQAALFKSQIFKELDIQSLDDLVHVFTATDVHINHSVLKNVSELDATHKLTGQSAFTYARHSCDRDVPLFGFDKL
jgi:hypothetical protein